MMPGSGKVAVVTGASRGIGRAIALALGGAGCRVIVNYNKNHDLAAEVAGQINSMGAEGIALKADCSDRDAVLNMFQHIETDMGQVHILVNNAGITRDKLSLRMSPQDFGDVIDLNLKGVFYCSQAAFSTSMMRAKEGKIINIASVVGQIGNIGQANYAASKGGVLGLTKSLAKEYANRGVCVNAVCPGFIQTDMVGSAEDIRKKIPLGRLGTPEEVASLVKFLALDPAGNYITGHSFNVDGGLAIGAT